MKILIASDSHDNWHNLSKAVAIANENACEAFFHAGDFISPPGLECFRAFNGRVHMVWGNNDGEKIGLMNTAAQVGNVNIHGDTMEENFGALRFHMNHYPGNAENAALSGKYDVVVHGHTHLCVEKIFDNGSLLFNPGELQGHRTGVASVIVFDTDTRNIEWINL